MKKILNIKHITLIPILLSFFIAAQGAVENKTADTIKRMQAIGTAVETYMEDHGTAPEVFSIDELARLLEPRYMEKCPKKDAWGNTFHFAGRNTHVENDRVYPGYWIGSGGTSGQFGGFLPIMTGGSLKENDMVYSNGLLVMANESMAGGLSHLDQ